MAGRGFSLKALTKDKPKEEEKDVVTKISTPTLVSAGRGRGIIFPSLLPTKKLPASDVSETGLTSDGEPAKVNQLIIGSGGRGRSLGREMFSNTLIKQSSIDKTPNSDPIASGSSATTSQEISAHYATTSGRGVSGSSDKKTSSDVNRSLEQVKKLSITGSGAIPKTVDKSRDESVSEVNEQKPVNKRGTKGTSFNAGEINIFQAV